MISREKKKKINRNLCLAYVWTALGFHGNTFRFVFDQTSRDKTRSLNNHISEGKKAHMDGTCFNKSSSVCNLGTSSSPIA